MYDLVWLLPALPFAGFLVLTLGGPRISRGACAWIACSTVGISTAIMLAFAVGFLIHPPAEHAHTLTLWRWIPLEAVGIPFSLRLDTLSQAMASVITGVGFLIHLYSTEYMKMDPDYNRFFAYLNLFVGFMLLLVLADNFVLLLVGWEGVGLCSYLLIGFWYRDPANGRAARKAFVVTRIGDAALLIGIFLIFAELGTLHIPEVLALAPERWELGSGVALAAALLILGGAVGKSAQLPLQTWLPDAMAGPTPVSALIHAATMVTAGVYLIARTHGLFELAPPAMQTVAVIGSVTLFTAACAALVQRDIKRVLAYSTISQIGYMFLALGVGAWAGALFHFMTHAWFKALLFLAAGAVINALHHEQDLFRMGGLRKKLPLVFWTFLIGAACLAALPLVTSGFYSKEKLLWDVWISPYGGPWFWAVAMAGAFVTALYSARLVALVFFGPARTQVSARPGGRVGFVLVILAIWSLIGGGIELPHTFAHVTVFSDFVAMTIPTLVELPPGLDAQLWTLLAVASVIVVAGATLGAWLYGAGAPAREALAARTGAVHRFLMNGWEFDRLYDTILVRPYVRLAEWNRADGVDKAVFLITGLTRAAHVAIQRTQHGQLRRYAAGVATGAVIILLIMLFQ